MRVGPLGFCQFLPQAEGLAGDLPAFSVLDLKKVQLAKLPAPASGFALTIHSGTIPAPRAPAIDPSGGDRAAAACFRFAFSGVGE
jgi:hypothetical protein